MSENYQTWVDRIAGGRENKPLSEGEIVKSSAGQPFGVVDFMTIQKKGFKVEVGKKGSDFIYHFYPEKKYFNALIVDFYDPMSEALLQAFKDADRIEADWIDEMNSWAVRARGFVDTVWGDELALRAIDILEQKLSERKALGE